VLKKGIVSFYQSKLRTQSLKAGRQADQETKSILDVCLASLASRIKGQTFLLCKFYKIIPPLISKELLASSESG